MFSAPSKSRQIPKIRYMGVSENSAHIKIKIKMPNLSQEPPASSEAPSLELEDMVVLCIFKIQVGSHNSENGRIQDQQPYKNQYQDAKPQSGTSSVTYGSISRLRGHGFCLHLKIKTESRNLKQGCIKDQ